MTPAISSRLVGSAPFRTVLSDDESLFRASLRQLLSVPPEVIRDAYGVDVGPGFHVVGEAGSGVDTVRVVRATRPDLLVLDLSMPRLSGVQAMCELRASGDAVPTVLLTGDIDSTDLLAAVHAGINGLVLKNADTPLLFDAMTSVLNGGCWVGQALVPALFDAVRPLINASSGGRPRAWNLTAREKQVLGMVAAGCPNREIAARCAVSEETIKHHISRLFAKVGASNRLELAMAANHHDPSAFV